MVDFVAQLQSGKFKVLFIHGVNPLFELPKSIALRDAFKNVPQIISFATFPDETAVQADYIFPDRHSLESWGYQKVPTGAAPDTVAQHRLPRSPRMLRSVDDEPRLPRLMPALARRKVG